MDVSAEFLVYKNPYNSSCQMSFSFSEYTYLISAGATPQNPLGELTALPRPAPGLEGAASRQYTGMEGIEEGQKGNGERRGRDGEGGKWRFGCWG